MTQVSTSATKFYTLLISLIITGLMTACSQQVETINPASQGIESVASARLDDSVIDSAATLRSTASFPIGTMFSTQMLNGDQKVRSIIGKEFNSLTVGLFMNLQWERGKFNFDLMDRRIKGAEAYGVRLHGHSLVYHIAAPDWITKFKGNTADFEQAVKVHVQTIAGRYKGRVKSWDVINEIIDWKTGKISDNPFRKMYATDEEYLAFVKKCFVWAHEADPDALLFLNEDVYERSVAKQNTMIKIINDFKKSGVPIHGLGTQMHINVNTPDQAIRTSIQSLVSTGLLIHLSELDIAINPSRDNNLIISNQLTQTQQLKYQVVVSAYKQLVPDKQKHGLTLWGFSDADTWLVTAESKREMPLLFDTNYNKKPVYYTFLNTLRR
ncbi:endo-1,4-beta-xylanase [Spirosoma sordidisoli]|uniref:Beta-xylanase n=1 Tax=Spirosoma sordidisoli TaxID=2502893 RepID=A0A4V1RWU4_9BACT|nr:endo-1,4-beta-xylanase [Spirosoma sordidisoli]RYC71478.1 1,4-beta-xylanase [Spirosoma sordidisoli]